MFRAPFRAIVFVVPFLAALPRGASAQVQRFPATGMQLIGIHAAYDWPARAPGIGMQVRLPLTAKVDLYPNGDLYFKDNGTFGHINLDVLGPFGDPNKGSYIGLGASVVRSGGTASTPNTTRLGPDFVIGVTSTRPQRFLARLYFEVHWTVISGQNPFQLMTGLNFRFF